MHHSTFNPDTQPAHDNVARTFARTLLQANSSIISQHIPGESNVIADSLSRDFHLSDSHLFSMLHSNYGPQMPHNLTMFPPPVELSSWIELLAQKQTSTMASNKKPKKKTNWGI